MMGVVIGGVLFACYAVEFNVIFGSTGQLFLCTGALAGLGGYVGDPERPAGPPPGLCCSPPSWPPPRAAC